MGNGIEKVLAKILEIHNLNIKPWIIMILIMAVFGLAKNSYYPEIKSN